MCTAYSDYSWESMAQQLGQNDGLLILKKPFDMVEVLQLAETLSKKWTLAGQARLRMADLDAMVNQRTAELRATNEQLAQEITERSQAQVLLSTFSTLGSLLSTARTVREAGQIIVGTADRLLGWDACQVDLYSTDTDMLTNVLNADFIEGQRKESIPASPHPAASGLARKALQEGGQLMVQSKLNETPPEGAPFGDATRPAASILIVPIRNGNAAPPACFRCKAIRPRPTTRKALKPCKPWLIIAPGRWTGFAPRKPCEKRRMVSNNLRSWRPLASSPAGLPTTLTISWRSSVETPTSVAWKPRDPPARSPNALMKSAPPANGPST